MTDTTNWLNQNSGGTGDNLPSVYFATIGNKVAGTIINEPRKVEGEFGERLVIELQAHDGSTALKRVTENNETSDTPIAAGDKVTLWVKPGQMAAAIKKALNEAAANGLTEGDTLAVAYSGDGEKKKAGWNAPKLYQARYTPAKPAVSVDNLV